MSVTVALDVSGRRKQSRIKRSLSRTLDQFYTHPKIARRCVAHALKIIGAANEITLWMEPSAGNGAFLSVLPQPCFGLDIAPAGAGIVQGDFLKWHPKSKGERIAVIGNPPFGKNSSLAIKFFNHAARFADYIAFIVPRTFEKDSTKRKLPSNMELVFEENIGSDCFTLDGAPYNVPTVFQVWHRTGDLRLYRHESMRHPDFDFLRSPVGADFAFQRVGARAGLVSVEGLRKSPQSHYFIKVRDPALAVMAILQSIDWSPVKHRTAGNPSIGKAELVAAYGKARS